MKLPARSRCLLPFIVISLACGGKAKSPGDLDRVEGEEEGERESPAEGGAGGVLQEPEEREEIDEPATDHQSPEWAAEVQSLLEEKCAGCHALSPNEGGGVALDLNGLVGSGWVVPGSPENSLLLVYLRYGDGQAEHAWPLLAGSDVDVFAKSIERLDPRDWPTAECADPEPLSLGALQGILLDDVSRLALEERPFTRYFSAPHSTADGCGAALEGLFVAAAELVNSLSRSAAPAPLRMVDGPGRIFAVDLRDHGWDAPLDTDADGAVDVDDVWQALVAEASPYGVELAGDVASELAGALGTSAPVLPVHAAIDAALGGGLYRALTGVDARASDWVNVLGAASPPVPVRRTGIFAAEPRPDRAVTRLGPFDDGGFAWVLEELEPGTLTRAPVQRPFAGGQIMFALPNGFWAFGIVAADGTPLDELPGASPDQPARAQNPVTCWRCHATGIQPFADDMGALLAEAPEAFDAAQLPLLRAQAVSPEAFDAYLEADERNAVARDAAGIRQFSNLSSYYNDFGRPLDEARAAYELGLSVDDLRTAIDRFTPETVGELRAVNQLESLRNGGRIERASFSAAYQPLLCALVEGASDAPAVPAVCAPNAN